VVSVLVKRRFLLLPEMADSSDWQLAKQLNVCCSYLTITIEHKEEKKIKKGTGRLGA
jgi:hypothetical protein